MESLERVGDFKWCVDVGVCPGIHKKNSRNYDLNIYINYKREILLRY